MAGPGDGSDSSRESLEGCEADEPREAGGVARNEDPALDWAVTRQHPAHDFRVFRVARHEARHPRTGDTRTFSVIESPDWVNVVALTDDDEIVLVRQYRHGIGRQTLEIPGGMIDPHETPEEAARRELREETGYAAERWERIGVVQPNPAIQTNRCYTLLGTGARKVGEMELDPGEVIEVETRGIAEIHEMVARGEITHALVVAAFYHLERRGGLTPSSGARAGLRVRRR